jgi:hypothetical protein
VPGPTRIALRVVGLVFVSVGVTCLVLLVSPGPRAVADMVGTCSISHRGSDGPCTSWNAAIWLWTGFCLFTFSGFVLRLVTRPDGKGPVVLDLRRLRRR